MFFSYEDPNIFQLPFRAKKTTIRLLNTVVGVAQLVRALGCGPGGRGFETHHSPHLVFFKSAVYRVGSFEYFAVQYF